jgi:hypothetical protein
MKSEKYLSLNSKLDRIEEALNKKLATKNEKQVTNEVAPIVAKAAPIILKNLPLILEVLPDFIKALDGDTMNDNSDKIETLTQFGELGQKVGEMFKDMKV